MSYLEVPGRDIQFSLFGNRMDSSRSIRVPEPPDVARRIVDTITRDDAMLVNPPLVNIRREAPGAFHGSVPGMDVTARMDVRAAPDGRGSIVTEQTHAESLLPGMAVMASTVHSAAASLGVGYSRAEERYLKHR